MKEEKVVQIVPVATPTYLVGVTSFEDMDDGIGERPELIYQKIHYLVLMNNGKIGVLVVDDLYGNFGKPEVILMDSPGVLGLFTPDAKSYSILDPEEEDGDKFFVVSRDHICKRNEITPKCTHCLDVDEWFKESLT